jgi:hypothetical protein
MWLHHDAAWWGLVLAIVGLALLLPASILANLLTPMLKNWWAERSVASTRKRIAKLEEELAQAVAEYPEPSETLYYTIWGLELLLMVTSVIASTGVLIVLILAGSPAMGFAGKTKALAVVLEVVAILATTLVFTLVVPDYTRLRNKISPARRKNMKRSIDMLRRRLS